MPTSEAELAKLRGTRSLVRLWTPLLLIGFSVFYFADVLLRATEKYFWYDELFTVYLCRLGFHPLWGSLRAGIDLNPPLFYVLTKASTALAGENLIGPRLPEIAGFWVFCLSMFVVVNRRAGRVAGFVAMSLPIFTGAFYYAYDARPHGLVIGFCGLALVCWQASLAQFQRKWWLIGFSLSLLAALLTHCYAAVIAVPFAAAELIRAVQFRRLELSRWLALVAPTFVAGLSYIPLLRFYNAAVKGTAFLTFTPPVSDQIGWFYSFLLGPGILIVLSVILFLALKLIIVFQGPPLHETEQNGARASEIALAACFVSLPVFGLLLAKALHSPFVSRYFLSSVAGLCMLVGFAIGARKREKWTGTALATVMACSLIWHFSNLVRHRLRGVPEKLVEPSSGFSKNSSLQGPLGNYKLLLSNARPGEPVLVMWPIEFLYLVNYAPELRSQLYYIGWNQTDSFYRALERFHEWSPFPYHTVTAEQFFRSTPRFLLFGSDAANQMMGSVVWGGKMQSLQVSDGRFTAEFDVKGPTHGETKTTSAQ